MRGHTYYEPTEYEQMLVAAGWVAIEDIDPDYIEYKRHTDDDRLTYDQWTRAKREWDRLNEIYVERIEPYIRDHELMPHSIEDLAEDTLAKMSQLEWELGY
jgi:hypothetical protein